jgi:teichuronic acid biosynthesis glycosyltransferase TuaC
LILKGQHRNTAILISFSYKMNILFVSSGNALYGISPLVVNQGKSLIELGHHVDFFTIRGKGVKGYFKALVNLRKYLRARHYDLIHAHYGLSGIISYAANRSLPLVVSFMGDDLLGSSRKDGKTSLSSLVLTKINKLMAHFFYRYSIVKSSQMLGILNIKNAEVIPNGVNLKQFYPEDKSKTREELNLPLNEIIIVFLSNPERPEKNFSLAKQAVQSLYKKEVRLIPVFNKNHDEIRKWLNAADVVILTSFHEGSPNVIKEAMACNCPIVSTDVGDVKNNIEDVSGCYISSYEVEEFAHKIIQAINFSIAKGRTNGLEKLIRIQLDATSIARRITEIYLLSLQNE